jgi:hypothetical protein
MDIGFQAMPCQEASWISVQAILKENVGWIKRGISTGAATSCGFTDPNRLPCSIENTKPCHNEASKKSMRRHIQACRNHRQLQPHRF